MLTLLTEYLLLHHVERGAAIQRLRSISKDIPLIPENMVWLISQASDPISLNAWRQKVLVYGDHREVVQIPDLRLVLRLLVGQYAILLLKEYE